MAKQKWQLQENFPASKIWFSKLKVPIKCPAQRTEKHLYCCGLHQQSRDKDAERQCLRFFGFFKGKGFRNLHAGRATRRRTHSMLSVRAIAPSDGTSQTLHKDTQLQMICLWGAASLAWEALTTFSVFLRPSDLQRLVTYLPASQVQVYKTKPGLWVHHEARWRGDSPGAPVTSWPWMLQGQKLQITNKGTLSRDEKIRRDFKKKYSKGAKNKIKINIWEKGKRQKEKEVEGERNRNLKAWNFFKRKTTSILGFYYQLNYQVWD